MYYHYSCYYYSYCYYYFHCYHYQLPLLTAACLVSCCQRHSQSACCTEYYGVAHHESSGSPTKPLTNQQRTEGPRNFKDQSFLAPFKSPSFVQRALSTTPESGRGIYLVSAQASHRPPCIPDSQEPCRPSSLAPPRLASSTSLPLCFPATNNILSAHTQIPYSRQPVFRLARTSKTTRACSSDLQAIFSPLSAVGIGVLSFALALDITNHVRPSIPYISSRRHLVRVSLSESPCMPISILSSLHKREDFAASLRHFSLPAIDTLGTASETQAHT
jgi:hypothetical protein